MTIHLSEERSKVAQFLQQQSIGILATADGEGRPHAATIYYVLDDDLSIYFITKEETTKVKNIAVNPNVALAVYDAQSQTTAQVTGAAQEVDDHNKLLTVFTEVLKKTNQTSDSAIPPVSKIKGGEYLAFCIKPLSLRLAQYTNLENGKPGEIFEVTLKPENDSK